MVQEKRLYPVNVAGLTMKLRTSHDTEAVENLVEIVDSRIKECRLHGKNISYQEAAVLTALHLAEDLMKFKRSTKIDLDKIETQAQEIFLELESSPVSQIDFEG